MKESEEKGYQAIIFLLLVPVSAVLNGWVLSVLWRWFVVPSFEVPGLGIAQAIGIATIVRLLTNSYSKSNKDTDWIALIGWVFFAPLFLLFYGWIVHFFL